MSADFKVAGMSLVMVEWLQNEEKRREEEKKRSCGEKPVMTSRPRLTALGISYYIVHTQRYRLDTQIHVRHTLKQS
jgi:hypothetical protein